MRFAGAVPKQYHTVCGRPLLAWTIGRFEEASSIDRIVLVVAEDQLLYAGEKVVDPFGFTKLTKIVCGGETRQKSVMNGLESLPASTDLVAIHDGARPLVSAQDIDRVVEAASIEQAAMLAIRASDTVKRVRDGYIINTLDRDSLYLAQTPQVFHYKLILSAHRAASDAGDATDDAQIVEKQGHKVKIVESTGPNTKVTTRQDMVMAEAFLREDTHA